MKELLIAYLSKTLNLTPEQTTELLYKKGENDEFTDELNDGVSESLLNLDAERVQTIKENSSPDTKEIFDNGYKKAQSELMTEFETKIKEEFGIESDAKGSDLISEIVTTKLKDSGKEVNDDTVKKHPLYLSLERTKASELDSLRTEYENKIKGINADFERGKVFDVVRGDARKILATLNPIISNNQTVANNRELDFLSKFDDFDYQPDESGKHLVIDKATGKRLEDAHGNPVSFESHVASKASLYYDFKKQSDKGNGGNDDDDIDNPDVTTKVPKSQDEYDEMIITANTAEERAAIDTAWKASQGND